MSDFMRPLNKRGRKNAPFMAELLNMKKIFPHYILSSPAIRAKQTAELLAEHINFGQDIVYEETLYEASSEQIERVIKSIDDVYESAFVVGHNPGFNDFASQYVGFDENIVTCGIVEIVFKCESFADISPANAEFIAFEYPKKKQDIG